MFTLVTELENWLKKIKNLHCRICAIEEILEQNGLTGGITTTTTSTTTTTTVAPITIQESDLVFADRVNMNNTAQEFTATAGGFTAQAVDALFLDVGENGRIYSTLTSSANNNAILGFYDSATKVAFNLIKAGFDIGGGIDHYFEVSGFADSGYTVTYPKKFGVFRVGASFKPQVSTDGVTWTDLAIFRGNNLQYVSSGKIYPVLDISAPGDGICSQPKIQKYSAGNIANLYINTGNSLAAGYLNGTDSESNIGQQGWLYLDTASDWFYNNKALSGQSINAAITAFPTVVAPLMVSGFSKIVVSYLEGTNELVGSSPAATFSILQTYINLVLNQISTAKIVLYMMPSAIASGGRTNANRLAYNALIAGLIGLDPRIKVVDLTGTPELNDANAYLNATYYQADGVHLKQAGYDLLASLGNPVLASF